MTDEATQATQAPQGENTEPVKAAPKKTFARVQTTAEQEAVIGKACEGSSLLNRQAVVSAAFKIGLEHIDRDKKVLVPLL